MGSYRNPILPGCHPDPSICRVGDEYFLVTSTFEYLPGLPVHRSRDLVHWELIGHAVDGRVDLSDVPASGGLFAPTIRHHNDRFYVVCTKVGPPAVDATASAGDAGRVGRSGHFIVTAEDPAGLWSDPFWIDGIGGIDPSLTFDGERVWLCGTRLAEPGLWAGQTIVWLRELDAGTLTPIGEEHLLWHGALENAVWAEGPHLLPRPGGGWVLLAAEGGTERDHAVCVAYADHITGPYRGDPGNPRLTHRDLGERAAIVNVGHADLVETVDGSTWAVLLATANDGGLDSLLGRQTHLVPVEWEQRRPLFAPGVGRVQSIVAHAGVPNQSPVPTRWEAEVNGQLDLDWVGVRRMPGESLESGPGLRLRASHAEPHERGPLSFLGRPLPSARTRITAVVVPAARGRAGTLLRVSEDALVELSVAGDGVVRLRRRADGTDGTVAESTMPAAAGEATGGAVTLTLDVDGFTVTATAAGGVVGSIDVAGLSPTRAGGFVGAWVGPFAVGESPAEVRAFGWTIADPFSREDAGAEGGHSVAVGV